MGHSLFWIVGGEYRDTRFDDLVEGTGRLFGPYPSRDEAELVWRRIMEQHRSHCLTRFTIAAESRRMAAG